MAVGSFIRKAKSGESLPGLCVPKVVARVIIFHFPPIFVMGRAWLVFLVPFRSDSYRMGFLLIGLVVEGPLCVAGGMLEMVRPVELVHVTVVTLLTHRD